MFTVGELLRNTRKNNGHTLEHAADVTKIRKKYLIAAECNDWSVFTSKVYITGVLRSYALFLGLQPQNVLAYFRRDYEKHDVLRFSKRISAIQSFSDTKKIIIGLICIVSMLIGGYLGVQIYFYFRPPPVEIISPVQQKFRNIEKVKILGKTQKESSIRIFNEDVYPDLNGYFQYNFPLKKGSNRITIRVTGPNGKVSVITREYILE